MQRDPRTEQQQEALDPTSHFFEIHKNASCLVTIDLTSNQDSKLSKQKLLIKSASALPTGTVIYGSTRVDCRFTRFGPSLARRDLQGLKVKPVMSFQYLLPTALHNVILFPR